MKYTKDETNKATEYLHEYLKPGDAVYTILRQVSRSGMSRHITTVISTKDGGNYDITYLVAKVLGERRADDGGIVTSGCGMDMGFETVYRLGYALWPKGFFCVGDKCNSNDHSNGDRDYNPNHLHKDGGYALRQAWL